MDAVTALARVRDTLAETAATLRATHITVAEDHPREPLGGLTDRKLLADLDESLVDQLATLDEAVERAACLARSPERGESPVRTAGDLARVHRLHQDADRRLRDELLDTDRVLGLRRLTRKLGPDWVVWARVALDGLGAARASARRTDDALVEAWFVNVLTAAGEGERSGLPPGPAPTRPLEEESCLTSLTS